MSAQQTRPAPSSASQGSTSRPTAPPGSEGTSHRRAGNSDPQTSSAATAAAPPSRSSKLDSALYNFYTKTSAVVLNNRLTHWHDLDVFAGLSTAPDLVVFRDGHSSWGEDDPSHSSPSRPQTKAVSQAITSREQTKTATKTNKWFSLPLPDLDIFKQELHLWRNASSFVSLAAMQASVEAPDVEGIGAPGAFVPTMVIDVILDPSGIDENSELILVRSAAADSGSRQDHSETLRVPSAPASPRDSRQELKQRYRPIVLERWRIDFTAFPPEVSPELPTLYKRCISHFRSLYALSKALPSQRLYQRIRKARMGQGPSADDLQLGCRLAAGEPLDDSGAEVTLKERLWKEQRQPSKDAADPSMETTIRGFAPIISPLGSLNVSVEYRNEVDFRVRLAPPLAVAVSPSSKQRGFAAGISSAELRPDEDYFRPKQRELPQGPRSEGPQPVPSAQPAPTLQPTESKDVPPSPTIKSKPSGLSVLRQTAGATPMPIPVSSPSNQPSSSQTPPPPSPTSGSSPTPSLFSTSLGRSRPVVAGLSSLRHQSSMAALGLVGRPTEVTPAAASPVIGAPSSLPQSAGIVEPAFLGGLSARRPSMSDRRLRSAQMLSSNERSGPQSPSQSPSAPLPVRSVSSQMRFGSYSPSSPSPLAQQMTISQSQPMRSHTLGNRALSNVPQGAAARKSPSQSSELGFSLRSVFQDYTPRNARGGTNNSGSLRQSTSASIVRPPLRRLGSGGSNEEKNAAATLSISGKGPTTAQPATTRPGQSPTVAPQMIQRYSRTPSYRRERRMISGSIGESEHEGLPEGGSAGLAEGSGGSAGSYSRSWQARIDARQTMIANAMQRGSLGSTGSSASPGSLLFRGESPIWQLGQRTPSTSTSSPRLTTDRRGSIDELVAMIESRGQAPSPHQQGSLASLRSASGSASPAFVNRALFAAGTGEERKDSPSSNVSPLLRRASQGRSPLSAGQFSPASTRPPPLLHGQSGEADTTSAASATDTPPTPASRGSGVLITKSDVDELLARMTQSITRLALPDTSPSSSQSPVSGSSVRPSQLVSTRRQLTDASIPDARTASAMISAPRQTRLAVVDRESTPPSPARMHRRLTSRSQSSLELYSPEQSGSGGPRGSGSGSAGHGATTGAGRSSYDDGDVDHPTSSSAYGYEEEEPAGRLELHSEPSTPLPSSPPRFGFGGGFHRTDVGRPDNGGGVAADPSDLERLRSFGQDLSSGRGRRTQSPWGSRRNSPATLLGHGGGSTATTAATTGGGPNTVGSYGAVRGFHTSTSQTRPMRVASVNAYSSRGLSGGNGHGNGNGNGNGHSGTTSFTTLYSTTPRGLSPSVGSPLPPAISHRQGSGSAIRPLGAAIPLPASPAVVATTTNHNDDDDLMATAAQLELDEARDWNWREYQRARRSAALQSGVGAGVPLHQGQGQGQSGGLAGGSGSGAATGAGTGAGATRRTGSTGPSPSANAED